MANRGRWLALLAALLGWMFDGLEMGLFPLVGDEALRELVADPALRGKWFGAITALFLVGAATGGVLFGWLGDKIGRVKAMTLSVLVYAGCSGLCALSQTAYQLAALRFLGALGMGGEWALGVALVMELWPDRSRVALAGWIGAFGNLGYSICAMISLVLNRFIVPDPGNSHWRLLMLSGTVPALLTIFIRLFVPESEKWTAEKEAGKAKSWSAFDLLIVLLGTAAGIGMVLLWMNDISNVIRIPATVLALVIAACAFLWPAWRYLQRDGSTVTDRKAILKRMLLAAGLSGVPLLATWAGVMWQYRWIGELAPENRFAKPLTQLVSSFGAALGCGLGAIAFGRFSRRFTYAVLCGLSLVSLIGFYSFNTAFGWPMILSAGWVGFICAAFYGWLPLYLPELFPTRVRAFGQGFGFNFGRILAAVGALQTPNLLKLFNNNYAYACSITAGVYLIGMVLIFFAPETRGKELPR